MFFLAARHPGQNKKRADPLEAQHLQDQVYCEVLLMELALVLEDHSVACFAMGKT